MRSWTFSLVCDYEISQVGVDVKVRKQNPPFTDTPIEYYILIMLNEQYLTMFSLLPTKRYVDIIM